MKHSKVKHIADYIYIAISFFLLLFISSCTRSKYDFIIGVSQCSDDEWRNRMNDELKREALFYPNLKIEIKTVKDNSKEQIEGLQRWYSCSIGG